MHNQEDAAKVNPASDHGESVDFANSALSAPTALELQVGHDINDDEKAYIDAARSVLGIDAKQASAAYECYCRFRAAIEDEESL